MEFTNLLLTVTCAALGVLIGFLAWWGNGVTKKLDALILPGHVSTIIGAEYQPLCGQGKQFQRSSQDVECAR